MSKRLMDILLSLAGIISVLLFFPLILLLIKLDSRGPVFFLGERIGKDMKTFRMYKFRTMIDTPVEVGESLSPAKDPRVTSFGRFLRRTKINELPQLINILKGEMTFVGPRPEAPDLFELYPEKAKRIFSVKPGLISPGTILGRNEEDFYPQGVDIKKYYIEEILPKKIEVDLEYLKNQSLFKDLRYIALGIKETLFGALSKSHIHDNRSHIYLFMTDSFLILCSFIFSALVYSSHFMDGAVLSGATIFLLIAFVILLSCNLFFGLYSSLIKYMSYDEIWNVLKAVTYGSLLIVLISWGVGLGAQFKMIAAMSWPFLFLSLSGLRLGLTLYWSKKNLEPKTLKKRRVFIFGAGDAGNLAYSTLSLNKHNSFQVVGFIDDAPDKCGKRLKTLKVLGNRHHIEALARLYKVEEVIVTAPLDNPDELNKVFKICQKAGLRYRLFSSLSDSDSRNKDAFPLRDLGLQDILPTRGIRVDREAVRNVFRGKNVLIHGSGSALGMELCHHILRLGCRRLIIVDRYESYLNELAVSLLNVFSQDLIMPVLAESDRRETIEKVFQTYRPDIVFHASMRKYKPFLTITGDDVVQANYVRTFNIAKVASKFNCEHFVMISSLMAAQRSNLIADSLRVAEVSLEHFFDKTKTRLIIVRIGDIIENRGGIVSIIEEQIRKQQIVTLPSGKTEVHLMSKRSVTDFILQALAETNRMSSARKVFVCEPSIQMPLAEVARKLGDFHGLNLKEGRQFKETKEYEQYSFLPSRPMSMPISMCPSKSKLGKKDRGFSSEEVRSMFKDFVLNGTDKLSLQNYIAKTQNLIKLCESDVLVD